MWAYKWVAVLALVAAIVYRQHTYYSSVRIELLKNEQPTWYQFDDMHCVTLLSRASNATLHLPDMVAAMRNSAAVLKGNVVYVGKTIKTVVASSQLPSTQTHIDVLVVTQWSGGDEKTASIRAFITGLKASGEWSYVASQGMKRNPLLNLLIPQALGVLSFSKYVKGAANLDTEASMAESTADMHYDLPRMHRIAAEVEKGGSPLDPVFIWNWLKKGTPEQQAADNEYGLKMMSMLAENGGGLMNIGKTFDLGEGFNDGTFDYVASVYYPGRLFFARLLRSDWMFKAVQGKQPGDSIAVATTPF